MSSPLLCKNVKFIIHKIVIFSLLYGLFNLVLKTEEEDMNSGCKILVCLGSIYEDCRPLGC
jgi:hypothetical protein